MKLKGLTRSTAPHLAESASHFADFSQADPNCAANWSTTINPMLCRVAAVLRAGISETGDEPDCVFRSHAFGQSKIQKSKTEMDYFFLFVL